MADAASKKPPVSRRQLIVIAVLGVILAVVLIAQFGGASVRPEDAKRAAGTQPSGSGATGVSSPRATAASRPASSAKAAPAPASGSKTPWPKRTAEAVGQHDPFAMPEPLARQALAQGQGTSRGGKDAKRPAGPDPVLAAMRSKGVDAVFRDQDGAVAVMNNRVVRVGDVLQGYRVVSIEDDGVVLAPSGSQDVREDPK